VANLGFPINTTSDNLFFFPSNGSKAGYLAFHNSSSLGANDIFYVKALPSISLVGKIENPKSSSTPISTEIAITVRDMESNSVVQEVKTSLANPTFSRTIIPGNYEIIAEGEGIQRFISTIEIPENFTGQTFALSIPIEAIQQQVPVAATANPPTPKPEVKQPPIVEPQVEPIKETRTEPAVEQKVVKQKKDDTPKKPAPKAEKRSLPVIENKPLKASFSSSAKIYTVQLMALRNPVGAEKFADVPNLAIVPGADGYYRYLFGQTESIDEAKIWQKELKEKGYSNAYVRAYPETGFTIQVMALKTPAKPNLFGNLSKLWVVQGSDGLYRYMAGTFATIDEAKAEMAKILGLGYKDVFIRKM
jgi:hypothetical protein